MSTVITLKPRQLKPADTALRTEVNKEALAYQELFDSIRADGFLNSISATALLNADGTTLMNEFGEPMYQLVDGFHRWTIATDMNLEDLPVTVLKTDDKNLLTQQIKANSMRIETRKAEYAQALKQIAQTNNFTPKELAQFVGKSEAWTLQQLSLTNLPQSVQDLINENKISALNAVNLAKLPDTEIENFVDRAMTDQTALFQASVDTYIKDRRKAIKEGTPVDRSFKPTMQLRRPTELRDTLTAVTKGDTTVVAKLVSGISDPVAAGVEVLKWALKFDDASIAEQQTMYDANEAKKAEDKAKRKEEAEAKKAAAKQAVPVTA